MCEKVICFNINVNLRFSKDKLIHISKNVNQISSLNITEFNKTVIFKDLLVKKCKIKFSKI